MRITLTDDVEGKKSGETIDVDAERAKWYLSHGYATTAAYNRDEDAAMSVPAKLDPTLAENRKDQPVTPLADQLADGLGLHTGDEPDPTVPPERPEGVIVERTNAKGDPEKGETGKDRVETRSEGTDPEDAPETNPELVETRTESADKVEDKTQAVEAAKDGADTTAEAEAAAKKKAARQRA